MAAGIEITNPSGKLIISAEAVGYRYLGQPTLVTSGSTMYRKRYLFQQETRIWETDDDLEFTAYATTVLVVDGAIL